MDTEHATVFKTPASHDSALSEVVRILVEVYRPERIYLFGSVARGDAGPDSDYDILVVVPDSAPSDRRRSRAAYEALWERRLRPMFWFGQPANSTAGFTCHRRYPLL